MTSIRIASALIVIGAIVAIIKNFGYSGITATVFILSSIALEEFGRMALAGAKYFYTRIYLIALGLISFAVSAYQNDLLVHVFVLSTLFIFIYFLLKAKDQAIPLEELLNKTGLSLLGILYAGLCPVYICLLAKLSVGFEWFIFALVVVFSGDTMAYFVGRIFGRKKLFSRISPNKSVEGSVGAIITSIAAGLAVRNFLLPHTDIILMILLCVTTSIISQFGDLCESMVKRSFNIKDSGHLMPGHGGVLDRIDGLMFGAPYIYVFAKFLVIK